MLLSTLELVITLCCILEQDRLHVTAANIMLGKPSRLSSTRTTYTASNANDGEAAPPANTETQLRPFWQGDLLGFYTVHNITIRSGHFSRFSGAYIGVSSVDIDSPNDDVTWCGQWPTDDSEGILTFNCSHEQPVRFVRVWRNITGVLSLREVEVEGTPRRQNDRLHVTAANIMLGKPSRLSRTLAVSAEASNANDGTMETAATTHSQLHPFWQGDLQGFYSVHNITIGISKYQYIRDAYIGVSSVEIDCPNDDVTWCGQWPTDVNETTLTFNCCHEQPVRFVRVWRNITDSLSLSEVEVGGTPRRQNEEHVMPF